MWYTSLLKYIIIMETIIIETEGKNLEKINAYLQEMNVSFKTKI